MPKDLSNIQAEINELSKTLNRIQLWHGAMEGAAAFILSNLPSAQELHDGAPVLMKYVNNTWMPIAESHFMESVSPDGSYQAKAYRRSVAHVPKKRVAIDVGANIGLWAKPMSADFKTLHCFEPQSLARACLVRNVVANNVILYPYALGEKPGVVKLHISRLALGGGMIKIIEEVKKQLEQIYPMLEETAEVRTLDSFQLKPDYLKIDVQGFEPNVLLGAKQTLQKHKPVIICEAGGGVDKLSGTDPNEALTLIESLGVGYEIVDRIGKDVVLKAT